MVKSPSKKLISILLTTLVILNNVVLAHAIETNFWSERKASQEPIVLASASTLFTNGLPHPTQILNQSLSSVRKSLPRTVVSSWASSLPYQYGQFRKAVKPVSSGSEKIVIHIQDVHRNLEAQTNIAQAIQYLLASHKIDALALEGSFDEINLQTFRTFPDQEIIRKVGDYLLSENKISGPVYAGLLSPSKPSVVAGVDDATLHGQNVEAYREAEGSAQAEQAHLEKLVAANEKEKESTLNKALLSFDQAVQRLRSGQVTLGDHIELLTSSIPEMEPSFETFLEALHLESSLSFTKIEEERGFLISQILQKMTERQKNSLLETSAAYKMGSLSHSDFYAYLSSLCRQLNVPLNKFPNMRDYIQYVLLTDGINPEELLRTVKGSEERIYSSLVQTKNEEELITRSNQLYLSGKLINFSMTKEEWSEYKIEKNTPHPSPLPQGERELSFKKGTPSPLRGEGWGEGSLSPFEKFYELAEARDHAMATNLIKLIEKKNASTAIVVTGGFHTDGLSQSLANHGFTVLSFTPKLTKVDSATGSEYLSVFMQEKTPLDRLFEGEKLFLAGNGAAGLNDAPFLAAGISAIAKAKINPNQTLHSLAPKLRIVGENISAIGRTAKGHIKTAKGIISLEVKTNAQGDIQKSSLTLLANTHFLSAALTTVTALIGSYLTQGNLTWPFVLGLYITYEALLFFGAFTHEMAELAADGVINNKSILTLLDRTTAAFHQNLLTAFFRGTYLSTLYHTPENKNPSNENRLIASAGLLTSLALAAVGAVLATHDIFFGHLLLGANLTLFAITIRFGGDLQALLTGTTNAFTCGIAGILELRTRKEQTMMNPEMDAGHSLGPTSKATKAKRDKQSLNRMGFNTKRRGFQSAGMMETVIMPISNHRYIWMIRHPLYAFLYLFINWMGWVSFPSANDLEIEGPYPKDVRKIEDPENRSVQMALKLVNTKRGEIINRLLVATGWLHKIAIFKGYEPHPNIIDPSFHTRFATGGPTERKEAHPHQFLKPRVVKIWNFANGKLRFTYKVLSTWIDHNGDFNGLYSPKLKGKGGKEVPLWRLFAEPKNKVKVSAWLQKVLGTEDRSKGDSPKISGMMDLLITQGMWFASARLAYQMAVAHSIDEAAPSKEALNELTEEIERAFSRHEKNLFPGENSSLSQINKAAIPAFLDEITLRLEKNVPFALKWTSEERLNFAEIVLQSFLYNDPQQAMRLLFALSAKGSTFGLLVDSTFNSEKKTVTASTQPMSIGHDPEQARVVFASDFNATKSGLPNFNQPGTRVMNLEQGGENGREIAVLDQSGNFRIYSLKRHRDLRKDEIDVRWAPTKDNPRLTLPPEPVHERMLDRDLALIPDEMNGVHDRWTDPIKKDESNLASADHFFKQLINTIREIEEDLKKQAERGEKIQVKRPLTPDLLFIGLENSFVAVREFGVQLKRFYPNLNIKFMTANEFNVAWNEDEIRDSELFGANTTVFLTSRHGGTFPTQNAAEVVTEIDRKSKANRSQETKKDEPKNELKGEALMAHITAELEKNKAGLNIREVFVVTEQPDSEMARTVGQSIKPSDPASKRVFAVKGALSMSEPAPLSVAKTHQFFTELLIYIGERMLAEKKLAPIARFRLTKEGLKRIKKSDERMRLVTVPGLVGRQPNNPGAEITTLHRTQLLKIAGLVGRHIREVSIFTLFMGAYTLFTVNFGFTIFQYWGPQALHLLSSHSMWTRITIAATLTTLFLLGLNNKKTERITKFMGILVGVPAALVIAPHLINLIFGYPFLSDTTWVIRAAKFWDSLFYVFGFWGLALLFRYKDGRQVFGRLFGTRTIFLVDRPGVAEIAYVYFTKVFSKAFGHNGVFVKQGDPANHFLQYESHTANPGDFIITGSPDPDRNSPLIQGALVPGAEMATSQTQFTVNILRGGAGPQTISVSQKSEGGSPDIRATLLRDKSEIEADNMVPDHRLVNNFIERRFDGFERLMWIFIFVNEVQKKVSIIPGIRWDGGFTQSAAGTHTTPAPLPPIELNEDAKNRNLESVGTILRNESDESPESMWVPKGMGGLFTALLYDPLQLPYTKRPSNAAAVAPPPLLFAGSRIKPLDGDETDPHILTPNPIPATANHHNGAPSRKLSPLWKWTRNLGVLALGSLIVLIPGDTTKPKTESPEAPTVATQAVTNKPLDYFNPDEHMDPPTFDETGTIIRPTNNVPPAPVVSKKQSFKEWFEKNSNAWKWSLLLLLIPAYFGWKYFRILTAGRMDEIKTAGPFDAWFADIPKEPKVSQSMDPATKKLIIKTSWITALLLVIGGSIYFIKPYAETAAAKFGSMMAFGWTYFASPFLYDWRWKGPIVISAIIIAWMMGVYSLKAISRWNSARAQRPVKEKVVTPKKKMEWKMPEFKMPRFQGIRNLFSTAKNLVLKKEVWTTGAVLFLAYYGIFQSGPVIQTVTITIGLTATGIYLLVKTKKRLFAIGTKLFLFGKSIYEKLSPQTKKRVKVGTLFALALSALVASIYWNWEFVVKTSETLGNKTSSGLNSAGTKGISFWNKTAWPFLYEWRWKGSITIAIVVLVKRFGPGLIRGLLTWNKKRVAANAAIPLEVKRAVRAKQISTLKWFTVWTVKLGAVAGIVTLFYIASPALRIGMTSALVAGSIIYASRKWWTWGRAIRIPLLLGLGTLVWFHAGNFTNKGAGTYYADYYSRPRPSAQQASAPVEPAAPKLSIPEQITAYTNRIAGLETQKSKLLEEHRERFNKAEEVLGQKNNQTVTMRTAIQETEKLAEEAERYALGRQLRTQIKDLQEIIAVIEKRPEAEDILDEVRKIQKTLEWRESQPAEQQTAVFKSYNELLKGLGVATQIDQDRFVLENTNQEKLFPLTVEHVQKVKPLSEYSADELKLFGASLADQDGQWTTVQRANGKPGETIEVPSKTLVFPATDPKTGKPAFYMVRLGIQGYSEYEKSRLKEKQKLPALKAQLEQVTAKAKTLPTTASTRKTGPVLRAEVETKKTELKNLEAEIQTLNRKKGTIMPIPGSQEDQYIKELEKKIQDLKDKVEELRNKQNEKPKQQQDVYVPKITNLLAGSAISYDLDSLNGGMGPTRVNTRKYLSRVPPRKGSSNVAVFNIGEVPGKITVDLDELITVLENPRMDVVVVLHGDESAQLELSKKVAALGPKKGRLAVVQYGTDLLDDTGLISYRSILKKATALRSAQNIVSGKIDSARLFSFTRIPSNFAVDDKLAAILTVLADLGDGRLEFMPGQLEAIMHIVKLVGKQT